jgi:LysR family transcriptional repressor of citA
MKTDFLYTFLSVIQTKSFTKTAHMTNLSQSTVSHRILELEKLFDCQLFHRLQGRVELTTSGKALIPYAQDVLALQSQAFNELHNLSDTTQNIKIGSVHAFYDCFLEQHIDAAIDHSDYTLSLYLKHSKEVIHGVVSGKYDIGISHFPSNYHHYHSKHLLSDPVIFVSANPKTNYASGIYYAQLTTLPVFDTNFFEQKVADFIFGQQTFKLTVDIGAKIIPYLIKNKAYAFLPKAYAQTFIDDGLLYEIPLMDYRIPPLDYFLIYSKELDTENNIITSFVQKLTRSFESELHHD